MKEHTVKLTQERLLQLTSTDRVQPANSSTYVSSSKLMRVKPVQADQMSRSNKPLKWDHDHQADIAIGLRRAAQLQKFRKLLRPGWDVQSIYEKLRSLYICLRRIASSHLL